jgi:hypothetical protein
VKFDLVSNAHFAVGFYRPCIILSSTVPYLLVITSSEEDTGQEGVKATGLLPRKGMKAKFKKVGDRIQAPCK